MSSKDRDERFNSTFVFSTREVEVIRASHAMLVALNDALGFSHFAPCPATYKEVLAWGKENMGHKGNGAWKREIKLSDTSTPVLNVHFEKRGGGYVSASFDRSGLIMVQVMAMFPGMFKGQPAAADVVKNFHYAMLMR